MLNYIIAHQLDMMLVLSSICGTIAILVLVAKALPMTRRMTLLFLEVSAMLLLYMDRLTYIYNGDVTKLGFVMNRISTFLDFVFTDIVVPTYHRSYTNQ